MFKWFPLFLLSDFEALGLTSKEFTVILDGIGERTITVFKGNMVTVSYENETLPLSLNEQNPTRIGGFATHLSEGGLVSLGIYED